MQFTEIVSEIERIAPLSAAVAWDASCVQVAARRQDVTKFAVCLDPTPASLSQALKLGAQGILSHHPLSLKPTLPRRLDAWHESLRLLFCADVPLYAAHTSLDVNHLGPAGWLAETLKLERRCVLEPVTQAVEGELPLGFGLAGDLPEPMTVRQIASLIAREAPMPVATVCGPEPQLVRRLAYCTGSGASLLGEAMAAGADLYVTGDIKYHMALEAEICLLDVGHHSLEEEMMRRMALLLQQRLRKVEVIFVPSVSPFRPMPLS
ncbi:MAG: Nif3-like dinuclear metal center hexameric protein [Desulfovibrio sp.]|nr:Nif3-like dinuclear metal center hexameric protein [Desulfovibrio sp.]